MASGKAAASGEPRRTVVKYVEAGREARTKPVARRVLARRGWAGEKGPFSLSCYVYRHC